VEDAMGKPEKRTRGGLNEGHRGIDKEEFWRQILDSKSPLYNFVKYNFVKRALNNGPDVDDVVIEVVEHAHRHIAEFDSKKGSFNTWLFAYAKFAIMKIWRVRKNNKIASIEDRNVQAALAAKSGGEERVTKFLDHAEFYAFLKIDAVTGRERAIVYRFLAGRTRENVRDDLGLSRREMNGVIKALIKKWQEFSGQGGSDV
jgi:RNA polymerase sigma factor (sigma-70 family)